MAKKRREVLIMTNKLTFTAYDGKTITYREWLCENPKGIMRFPTVWRKAATDIRRLPSL